MALFRKKCEYCNNKIDRGKEVKRNVKIIGFVGTHPKYFCCEEHANRYEKEVSEHCKKGSSGGCC